MLKAIQKMRIEIDEIDHQIIDMLSKRNQATKEIIAFKKENDLPIYDKNREIEKLDHLVQLAKEKNLSPHLVQVIYRAILRENQGK